MMVRHDASLIKCFAIVTLVTFVKFVAVVSLVSGAGDYAGLMEVSREVAACAGSLLADTGLQA